MLVEQVNMISSVDRLAWTSTSERGGLSAFKHRHGREFEVHYYGHTTGLQTRRQAAEAMECGKQ